MTEQQQWNRYVRAFNFCIEYGYYIGPTFSKRSSNVRSIRVSNARGEEVIIQLKPRKYKPMELFWIIYNRIKP